MERFSPRVMVDGRAVPVEGWMFVLAAAMRGFDWAVEEASKPEFRERVLQRLVEDEKARLEEALDRKLDEVEAIRKQIKGLR